MSYTVVIDEGTTSTRALLFDENGNVVKEARRKLKTFHPCQGWVEQSAEDIYEKTVDAIEEVREGIKEKVEWLALTNQRETVVAWDKKGNPLYNAVVWMDKRGASLCEKMKREGLESVIAEKTGLLLDPYFSASKMRWMLENVEGVKETAKKKDLMFGTIDSFLLWKFTGKHLTEPSNASRTLLFNVESLKWDEELLKLFSIPPETLPDVVDSAWNFGGSKFGNVVAVLGDQQSSLFGNGCYEVGEVKCTYGTGAFILVNIGKGDRKTKKGLLKTIAWRIDGKTVYALEGSVLNSGRNVNWLKDNDFVKNESEFESLASSVPSSQGVFFVPALDGLGAPRWKPNVRAMFLGISSFHTKAHLVRAVLDSMAFSVAEVVEAFEKSGVNVYSVSVDGGAAGNDLLIQTLCDTLKVPIKRPRMREMTAYGAFLASGVSRGKWTIDDLKSRMEDVDVFEHRRDISNEYNRWKRVEELAVKWSDDSLL